MIPILIELGCLSEILKRTPRRYMHQEPVLLVLLGTFFAPKGYQFQGTLSPPGIFFSDKYSTS